MSQTPAPKPAARPGSQEPFANALRTMVPPDRSVRRRQMTALLHAVVSEGGKR